VATGEGAVLCLGEAAFAGAGGFLAGRFVAGTGLPLWAAAIVAVISAGILGIVIGAIGARLDQIGFALVTLAFALFCEQFAFNIVQLVPPAGVPYPTVTLFGLTQARTNVLLGFVAFVILAAVVVVVKRGMLGRFYAALRGNPISSESLGLNVRALRTAVFAVGAAIAGLGGVLLGINEQELGSPDVALAVGLVWLAVVVTFGVRGIQGAFLAGLAYAVIPAIFSQLSQAHWVAYVPTVLFGLGAVGLATEPRGFLAPLEDNVRSLAVRFRSHPDPAGGSPSGGTGPVGPADLQVVGK
jgi:branched-chain amino acid transport system permease protein